MAVSDFTISLDADLIKTVVEAATEVIAKELRILPRETKDGVQWVKAELLDDIADALDCT